MRGISSVIKIHLRHKLSWFYLPWIIMSFSFLVNLLIGVLIGGEALYTGGLATIYIFMFVTALVTAVQLFPFSMGFSIRRTDFYLGTLTFILLISIFSSAALVVLSQVEVWTGSWGDKVHFFHLPYLSDGSWLVQFVVNVILILMFAMLGLGIGAFFLRFRGIRTFITLAAVMILISGLSLIAMRYEWWGPIFIWFTKQTAFDLTLWMIPIVLIIALCSRQWLRKSTV
ncbi:hypothetical protein J14TS5_17620 [Paenibacillus lautus]|uniref:hypothetical protein n=1 Tax=Paenibacillus lautus TaxID=1401 RepID=UPI001B0BDFD6|nr:hypothetical protein [Paenibacillus lautus]GIO96676.1 hypothetical protein J14TS5_17620 [Paenibacillus lautus]